MLFRLVFQETVEIISGNPDTFLEVDETFEFGRKNVLKFFGAEKVASFNIQREGGLGFFLRGYIFYV